MNEPPIPEVTAASSRIAGELPDFRQVFERSPGCSLIVDARFGIVAVSDAYCRATMTSRDELVGRTLFDVFPGNSGDRRADGIASLRTSILNVIRLRAPDRMAEQTYDIRRPDGVFEERYWRPLNSPIFGADGYVRFVLHTVEDVTELARARKNEAAAGRRVVEQERNAAALRHANSDLVERLALLRASLERLSRTG